MDFLILFAVPALFSYCSATLFYTTNLGSLIFTLITYTLFVMAVKKYRQGRPTMNQMLYYLILNLVISTYPNE